ncbi:hypothetical protein [Nocardia heshunensis]
MTVGAVREKPDAAREQPAAESVDGTPGLAAPGEMSSKVLAGLVILSMGVVFALIGGTLRAGLENPGGAEETGTPSSSTTQPVNAQPPAPAPAPPPPAPAAPVQLPAPAPAPQTQQYVPAPAQVEVAPETAAAPPAPPPPPAPPSLPDILAPILPFLLPPPPPPPPAP